MIKGLGINLFEIENLKQLRKDISDKSESVV